ncbi:MAG: hypothetical protein PHI35_03080 [Victivallaceae bacterium]|nr:hypothetical protein [Victivallaceae bacterium]
MFSKCTHIRGRFLPAPGFSILFRRRTGLTSLVAALAAVGGLFLSGGCVTEPATGSYNSVQTFDQPRYGDAARKSFAYHGIKRNPVVLIHGFLGSNLASSLDGSPVWGVFRAGRPAAAEIRRLAWPMTTGVINASSCDLSVEPASIMAEPTAEIAGLRFTLPGYDRALAMLEAMGYAGANKPLSPQIDHPTLFTFSYDWRGDIPGNARRLGEFLRAKRAEISRRNRTTYGVNDYEVKFDLVAHSMGGLIARYYLMYGEKDLPEGDQPPVPDWSGADLVEKMIAVGTPNDGYLDTFVELNNGLSMSPGGPHYPAALLGTYPAIYQMLPGESGGEVVLQHNGKPLDIFDFELWRRYRWGLASPAMDSDLAVILPEIGSPQIRRDIALDHLRLALERARRFRRAMAVDSTPPDNVMLILFAGDAAATSHTVEVGPDGSLKVTDYEAGDGKILASSARFDRFVTGEPLSFPPVHWRAVIHLPAAHMGFFSEALFQDNASYWLLLVPTAEKRQKFTCPKMSAELR